MLKRIICFSLVCMIISACGQDQVRGPRMSPAETANLLKDRLELTDEQQSQVEKILEESQKEMQEFRQSFKGDRGEMRTQIRALREATDKRIKELLNDKQKEKYMEYREEQMQNMRGRFRENRGDRD